jgi:hypothetical protein
VCVAVSEAIDIALKIELSHKHKFAEWCKINILFILRLISLEDEHKDSSAYKSKF